MSVVITCELWYPNNGSYYSLCGFGVNRQEFENLKNDTEKLKREIVGKGKYEVRNLEISFRDELGNNLGNLASE